MIGWKDLREYKPTNHSSSAWNSQRKLTECRYTSQQEEKSGKEIAFYFKGEDGLNFFL